VIPGIDRERLREASTRLAERLPSTPEGGAEPYRVVEVSLRELATAGSEPAVLRAGRGLRFRLLAIPTTWIGAVRISLIDAG